MNNTRHLYTKDAGLTIPLGMSAITGGLLGSIVLTVYIWQGWRGGFSVAVLVGLVVTFTTWLLMVRHWFINTLEYVTGFDINQDGVIGDEPTQERQETRHTIKLDMWDKEDTAYPEMNAAVLPFSESDMQALAVGLLSGKAFTEREWTGRDKPLSAAQFREAREVMKSKGLIEPISPKDTRQGYKLSKAGVACMRYFASTSPLPGFIHGAK